jgi:hypothetical protein
MNPKKIGQLIIITIVVVGGYVFYTQVFGAAIVGKTTATGSLQDGLVAWWTFDGPDIISWINSSNNISDKSGNGNTLDLAIGLFRPVPESGIVGQSLYFDGIDDYASAPSSASLDFGTGDFSVSFWMKTSSKGGLRKIVQKYDGSATGFYIGERTTGILRANIEDGVSSVTSTSDGADLSDAVWHHVVVNFDRDGNMTRYVDGVQYGTADDISGVSGSVNVSNVFGFSFSSSNYDGFLDDVRVYNRILSVSEIGDLYNSTKGNIVSKTKTSTSSINTGLVGWWTFDGSNLSSSVASDSSGQGNDGTLTNSPVPAEGKLGQALLFDGVDDYVSIPSDPSLDLMTSNMTIEAWIKINNSSTDKGNIYEGLYGKPRLEIGLDDSLRLVLRKADDSGVDSYTGTSGKIKREQWHHVAGVYDGSNVVLYVDGIIDKTIARTGDMGGAAPVGYRIGGRTGSFLKGRIDNVRVYNRALSADEIRQRYNMTKGSVMNKTKTAIGSLQDGLVGHWTFDGPDMVSNVADVSGQGNNGTLVNFTSTTTVIGKLGQALEFDGVDDNVDVGNDASLDPTTEMSIGVWFKTGATGVAQTIYYSYLSNADAIEFRIRNDKLEVRTNASVSWTSFPFITGVTNVVDGEWHYGVFVLSNSGQTLTLYLDGVSDGTTTGDAVSGFSPIINRIGKGSTQKFNGMLDDVRVYNRALSADEVKQLYIIGK